MIMIRIRIKFNIRMKNSMGRPRIVRGRVRLMIRIMSSIRIRIRITTKNNMVGPPSPWALLGLGLGL